MEDDYESSFSKLALAATSAQLAKVVTVQEFGVGEDLCFNFSDVITQTCMRTKAKTQVRVPWSLNIHFIRILKDSGIEISRDKTHTDVPIMW